MLFYTDAQVHRNNPKPLYVDCGRSTLSEFGSDGSRTMEQ